MPVGLSKLPDETIASLRSAFIVTSFASCVTELLHNALDAGPSHIEIAINKTQWLCRVSDSGSGISATALTRLGQRYFTSKHATTQSGYGFRGEALASISEISFLDVWSKPRNQLEPHHLLIRGGVRMSSAPTSAQRVLAPFRTVVQVKDLFYKWPVRRKTAAVSTEAIRKLVEQIALMHPDIVFTMLDLEKHDQRIFSFPKVTSTIERWNAIFGPTYTKNLSPVDVKDDQVRLLGFISQTASTGRQLQYLYINDRPIVSSTLSKAVQSFFSSSSFSALADLPIQYISPKKRHKLDNGLHSRKIADRYPVYCLNIIVPLSNVEVLLEPDKKMIHLTNEAEVISVLELAVNQFLIDNGYKQQVVPVSLQSDTCPVGRSSPKASYIHRDQVNISATVPADVHIAVNGEGYTKWVDPTDGQTYIVNRQTGQSRTEHEHYRLMTSNDLPPHVVNTSSLQSRDDRLRPERPEWMQNLSNTNDHENNPRKGRPISRVELSEATVQRTMAPTPFLSSSHRIAQHTWDRADLANAHVIAQVDTKFILCHFQSKDMLALIDQHAADERVNVERLLSELCLQAASNSVSITEFAFPHAILLSIQEYRMLMEDDTKSLADLQRWGFDLLLPSDPILSDSEWTQVTITHVPTIVERRLRREPWLLRDLIGNYLLQLQDQPSISFDRLDVTNWTSYLAFCPRGLLELVNSKACRGAIMFNDRLTVSECEDLVHRLAQTNFPFQCAHGRPCLVPIISLQSMT